MYECIPINSHIVKFTSIINELDMIYVKIEDEDQALLLLYSLFFYTRVSRKLSSMETIQLSSQ